MVRRTRIGVARREKVAAPSIGLELALAPPLWAANYFVITAELLSILAVAAFVQYHIGLRDKWSHRTPTGLASTWALTPSGRLASTAKAISIRANRRLIGS